MCAPPDAPASPADWDGEELMLVPVVGCREHAGFPVSSRHVQHSGTAWWLQELVPRQLHSRHLNDKHVPNCDKHMCRTLALVLSLALCGQMGQVET